MDPTTAAEVAAQQAEPKREPEIVSQAGPSPKRKAWWLSRPALIGAVLLIGALAFFIRENQLNAARRAAVARVADALAASFVPSMLGNEDTLSREQMRRVAEAGSLTSIGLSRPDGTIRYRYNLPDAVTSIPEKPTQGQWSAGAPGQSVYITPIELADSPIGYLRIEMPTP